MGTLGSWCGLYERQPLHPLKLPPRGDKDCPNNCSSVGNCHHDYGQCECPAGWAGEDCSTPSKRPCTNDWRDLNPAVPQTFTPRSHTGADGHDLNLTAKGWTASRCGGWCDEDTASCHCGYGSKYRRIPAPPGAPYGTPPIQPGRQLHNGCTPKTASCSDRWRTRGWDGRCMLRHAYMCSMCIQPTAACPADAQGRPSWGQTPWADLYGPAGWCEQEHSPAMNCACPQEGWVGHLCDEPVEMFCINQCSGHGLCHIGFCKCHAGWYGLDCSRKRASLDMEAGYLSDRPWLAQVVKLPAAMGLDITDVAVAAGAPAAAAGATAGAARALLGSATPGAAADPLNSSGSGIRVDGDDSRRSSEGDTGSSGSRSDSSGGSGSSSSSSSSRRGAGTEVGLSRKRPFIYIYDLPPQFLSRMWQYRNSKTFDAEEADYFFVSPAVTCLMHPIYSWADTPYWHGPIKSRTLHAVNMWVEVKRWLQQTLPYWERRGGRDHIWLALHDEAPCYIPTEIYNSSIIMSHWGRLGLDHKSNTAYPSDNYSKPQVNAFFQPQDYRLTFAGHACYTPGKDLLIPVWKPPHHYSSSPLAGAAPVPRTTLLSFKGDLGERRLPWYSRGIRQKLRKLAQEHGWEEKYRILILASGEGGASYSQLLASSKFCLVAPGDGWSARAEDSILHGCVPVLVMDYVQPIWDGVLDWDSFSVRIAESALESLPETLLAISGQQLSRMQEAITHVWHRFAYTTGPYARQMFDEVHGRMSAGTARQSAKSGTAAVQQVFYAVKHFPHHDDAFHSIMQWLLAKIPDTR
ncbi:MAG: hypothetical protein WDW38_009791 [Sanguina aurantia]